MAIDTLIRGGLLVDGSGSPARHANLAIADGRIVGIGDGLAPDPSDARATTTVVARQLRIVLAQVGHMAIRRYVMGPAASEREATEAGIEGGWVNGHLTLERGRPTGIGSSSRGRAPDASPPRRRSSSCRARRSPSGRRCAESVRRRRRG